MTTRWARVHQSLLIGCISAAKGLLWPSGRPLARSFLSQTSLYSTNIESTSPVTVSSSPSPESCTDLHLVVGDGDLSFSSMLSASCEEPLHLVASVWEDEETHRIVYRDSTENKETIRLNGQSVFFGIDATQLSSHFPGHLFDRITFNFPHWKGKANNRANRELLDNFLASASKVLSPGGEIHIVLCDGQGGMEALHSRDWKLSWKAAAYAADHGLLLHQIDPFEVKYNKSSHRGVDRPFLVRGTPFRYVFGFPNGKPVAEKLQIAFRHELRLIMDAERLALCPHTKEELYKGDSVEAILRQVTSNFPGIRAEAPMKDFVTTKHEQLSLLVFLVVYRGDSMPITRDLAEELRAAVEAATKETLSLDIAKPGRMVSTAFPYSMMQSLIDERLEDLASSCR